MDGKRTTRASGLESSAFDSSNQGHNLNPPSASELNSEQVLREVQRMVQEIGTGSVEKVWGRCVAISDYIDAYLRNDGPERNGG